MVILYNYIIWLICSEHWGVPDVAVSNLCASTAKVRSLWMRLRIMLTSCGLKSCRGRVWPGTSITAVCGRTGMVWQLSSSWTVRPWNSSMSEPRYCHQSGQCQCIWKDYIYIKWHNSVKLKHDWENCSAWVSLTACDVGRLGSKVMVGFSASSLSRSSVSMSFSSCSSSSSSLSGITQEQNRDHQCLIKLSHSGCKH